MLPRVTAGASAPLGALLANHSNKLEPASAVRFEAFPCGTPVRPGPMRGGSKDTHTSSLQKWACQRVCVCVSDLEVFVFCFVKARKKGLFEGGMTSLEPFPFG